MNDVCLVQSVFNLTSLDIVHCLRHVHRNGTSLRVRHQALRSKDTAQTSDNAHHIRCRHYYVEIKPAFVLDLRNELLCSYKLSACSSRLICLGILCKYQYTHLLTSTVRQYNRATDLLVCVTSVTACSDMNFDGLVKLRYCGLLRQRNRVFCVVERCAVDCFRSLNVFFSSFHIK